MSPTDRRSRPDPDKPTARGSAARSTRRSSGSVHEPLAACEASARVNAFRTLLRTAPLAERVRIEREGVPYQVVKRLIDDIFASSTEFQTFVRIPKATFTKKMRDKSLFAGTTGQSVVGLMELINKVEDMLAAEPDNPAAKDFHVERWVGQWIQRPQPALGGLAPAELMDTPSGRASVMRVLGAVQSGAYQ